jgi:hypothetical protein
MQEIEHLVKMANQIAHLQRFWAPSMRRKLLDHQAGGGDGLQWPVQEALQRLAGA